MVELTVYELVTGLISIVVIVFGALGGGLKLILSMMVSRMDALESSLSSSILSVTTESKKDIDGLRDEMREMSRVNDARINDLGHSSEARASKLWTAIADMQRDMMLHIHEISEKTADKYVSREEISRMCDLHHNPNKQQNN